MNLQTFTAESMTACLLKVKQAMGPNAVILHTRTYAKRSLLGLRRQEFVEITAGKPMGAIQRRRPAPPDILNHGNAMLPFKNKIAAPANVPAMVGAGGGASSVVAITSRPPGIDLLDTPAVKQVVGVQMARDIDELKKLVSGLVDTIHKKEAPNVPEELFEYYLKLIQNQVSEELAREIVTTLRKSLRPEHLVNDAFVKEKIAEQIEKMIPTAGPIARSKTVGPHVVALIGQTGVGKTTTIAKLAANIKLRDRKNVGLITIDTYRIAAIDQLKRYADILGAPLCVTNSAEELRNAIRSMRDCEYVLIDTAGRSPRDTMKIKELKNFLDAATPDEIHLVLSSTASEECSELAIEKFGEVHFDKVIFTKIDEAAHVGAVLNALHKLKKSLSYITIGQDVPNDIEEGKARRLATLILGGPL